MLMSERGVVCPIVGTVIPTGTESPMPRRTIFHGMVCVRSLIQSQPDLEQEVSIQKIHGSLKQAACLRGDQIRVAVEQNIEVR